MSRFSGISIATPTTPSDFEDLARLAGQLAVYHGDDFQPTSETLAADYGVWYRAALARTIDCVVIGFAGWYTYYDIHTAARGMELQNLFVDAGWRAQKIGFQLVKHVAAAAVQCDCARLRIGVRKDNALAIAFYDRLGCERADRASNWICRFDQEKLRRILAQT